MSLQQLVSHLNNKFATEHGFDFRPFILQNGEVSGLFGKNRLSTQLAPVRLANNLQLITGYAAQMSQTEHFFHCQQTQDIENLLSGEPGLDSVKFSSIINFDRLCRTVHLLNFLNLKRGNDVLFLEVDPRHIMGVKHHHGAYFEEIILECGFATQNVVISLATSGIQQEHHDTLLQGLNNYRECGYKIALNVGHLISADRILNLICSLAPDFVGVSAPNESYADLKLNASLMAGLSHLRELTHSLGGQIIMQDAKQAEQALTAIQLGFDLVQGDEHEKKELSKLNYLNSYVDVGGYAQAV